MASFRLPLLLVLAFAPAVTGCGSKAARVAKEPVPDRPHVTVMTFNVNYGLAGDPDTLRAVADEDADVVFLQETTEDWETLLRAELAGAYPHMTFKHHPPAGGLAVLSKLPLAEVEYLEPQDWFPAARVVLDAPLGQLQVLNAHLRPPVSDGGSVVSGYFSTKPVRRREIEQFASSLDPSLPTLIVGDFNEGEGGRALTWLRDNRGMRSALPEFSPHAQTWRWRTSVMTLRGRYDHLVYDPRLEPLSVRVRPAGRSDHLPVVGVFALADAAPSGSYP